MLPEEVFLYLPHQVKSFVFKIVKELPLLVRNRTHYEIPLFEYSNSPIIIETLNQFGTVDGIMLEPIVLYDEFSSK